MTNSIFWLALGVVILVAGSRWTERIRRRFPISNVLGGGWALLVLGIAVGPRGAGVLDGERLSQVQPILLVLLTWSGVVVGLQCQAALVRAIPAALWRWITFDLTFSLLLSVAAAGLLARIWQPDSPAAAQILLTGIIAAIAIGWNPETRSLGIRADAPAMRMAVMVQSGAGALAICSIAIATLALQCVHQDFTGAVIFAPYGGMVALAMECGAVIVVSLGAYGILRDSREDDARTTLIMIGALCLLSGIAVAFGGSGLLTGLLFGAMIGLGRRRLRGLEHLISYSEPIVASGCFFFAGITLAFPGGTTKISSVVIVCAIALSLSIARRVLKPLIMNIALASVRDSVALDSPAARGPVRQAPLTIVVLLAFAIQDSSGLADQLLGLAVLISLMSTLSTFWPRHGRSATK